MEDYRRMVSDTVPENSETLRDIIRKRGDDLTEINALTARVSELESAHGWAYYDDGQYTSGSPLSITSGRTQLTIDGLGSSNNIDYLPSGAGPWWSGNKITPSNIGDCYILRFDMTCIAGGNSDRFDFELEIAPGNILYDQTFEMTKGAGVAHNFGISIPIFSLATFLTNGGKFYINTANSFTVYDVGILITRLYKAQI